MQTTSRPAALSEQASKRPLITWEPLPEDYLLPDDPVDNIVQPLLAAILREILELAGLVAPECLIATNFGICATVEEKTVVKAPDWVYVPKVTSLPDNKTRRSYTPNLEGDPVEIVMEFISETEGGEYSVDPNYPYGKWWFYERILQVPGYFIFRSEEGRLEGYKLAKERYEPQDKSERGRYWVEAFELFLGVWQGTRANHTGYWLRWWDADGNLLPWGTEKVAEVALQVEQERERAEQEKARADRLAEKLRSLGVEPPN
ncbi:MAG: Uma2 family endonuclease [Cyanobacteria bacterium J06623_5]